jgi:hypothetical protein
MGQLSVVTETVKAELAAQATTRWAGVLTALGYVVFYVHLAVAAVLLIAGLAADEGFEVLIGLVAAIWTAVLGAVIAAPLLAFSSYLTMGARRTLADIARAYDADMPGLSPLRPTTSSAPTGAATGQAKVPGSERVRILSEEEKRTLAAMSPPQDGEGWYEDPLGSAALRRWNGTQWTGQMK